MNAVECFQLTKSFGDKIAVDGLELRIGEGELFALLGVNGAGKTSTIKLLTGLLLPTAGRAEIFGKDLAGELSDIKPLLGISPQETAVAPNLSVRENLEFMAGVFGAGSAEAAERGEKMMEEFSLTPFAKQKAKTLSGGWQRRLSIAMALISKPKLLFLDEPTLGLDVLARRELWNAIKALKGKVTVVLTTHYMEEAEALSDRIGILADGKLVACGTASELVEQSGAGSFEDAFIYFAGGARNV